MPVAKELVTPPGRRVQEPARVHLITEPGPDGHTHCASIDVDGGDGTTTRAADGHHHQVVGLELLAAKDGHTHELGTERCQRTKHQRGWCHP